MGIPLYKVKEDLVMGANRINPISIDLTDTRCEDARSELYDDAFHVGSIQAVGDVNLQPKI